MDDSRYVPRKNAVYAIYFKADGTLSITADGNAGRGNWTFEPPSSLQFGPLATTRMMCEPGSISSRFVRDLEFVRSFVMADDHLFLATMADGAILEFSPAPATTPADF
jgi:heat shock protein HslJ